MPNISAVTPSTPGGLPALPLLHPGQTPSVPSKGKGKGKSKKVSPVLQSAPEYSGTKEFIEKLVLGSFQNAGIGENLVRPGVRITIGAVSASFGDFCLEPGTLDPRSSLIVETKNPVHLAAVFQLDDTWYLRHLETNDKNGLHMAMPECFDAIRLYCSVPGCQPGVAVISKC